MRLLDRVARCRAPLILPSVHHGPTSLEVAGPSRFAAQIGACPLRFVLGDDLTRASTELAFADGARLAGCLDLLRMPAPDMWIEWNDEAHMRVIHETQSTADFDAAALGRRVGILLQASANGLTAVGRTFWADAGTAEISDVTLSPLEMHIDLRGEFPDAARTHDVFSGGFIDATYSGNSATTELLNHVRFRFDESWAGYYREAARNADFKRRLMRRVDRFHRLGRAVSVRLPSAAERQRRHALDCRVARRHQSQTPGKWTRAPSRPYRSERFA